MPELVVTSAELPMGNKKVYLILHNIRSAYNVGSIFRTADGVGAFKVYLTGYTPAPYGGKKILMHQAEKMIAKTALGAEKHILWEKTKDIGKLIQKLKKEGVRIVAVEQSKSSVDYKKFRPKFPLALVLGNEVRGIDKKILKQCDAAIEIPMRGKKESLNVAVAAGIVMYELSS